MTATEIITVRAFIVTDGDFHVIAQDDNSFPLLMTREEAEEALKVFAPQAAPNCPIYIQAVEADRTANRKTVAMRLL